MSKKKDGDHKHEDASFQFSIPESCESSLDELERVFMAIAMMEELTSKTRDYIVSFGENVSTRIVSAYLNKLGKGTCQEWESYAVNTCGRGGADLTAATIARDT
ncbi:hypothetical protein QYE76_059967 [Lolium multiflorum]|uniref:Uncharacterized protein n=1 Tax=Lolium multiflorum TaxID=4521 RepID=A0AAD8S1A8_LOLMU|nr:hypothetical protein QYE76_059967 [Lolium multiflorum]